MTRIESSSYFLLFLNTLVSLISFVFFSFFFPEPSLFDYILSLTLQRVDLSSNSSFFKFQLSFLHHLTTPYSVQLHSQLLFPSIFALVFHLYDVVHYPTSTFLLLHCMLFMKISILLSEMIFSTLNLNVIIKDVLNIMLSFLISMEYIELMIFLFQQELFMCFLSYTFAMCAIQICSLLFFSCFCRFPLFIKILHCLLSILKMICKIPFHKPSFQENLPFPEIFLECNVSTKLLQNISKFFSLFKSDLFPYLSTYQIQSLFMIPPVYWFYLLKLAQQSFRTVSLSLQYKISAS